MSLTAPYDARAVANYILDIADSSNEVVTQLTLLKILYFAHGWYLVKTSGPLVSQPIECWKHGPVIKVVRDSFKNFGAHPVTSRAERLDLKTGEYSKVDGALSEEDERFVSDIFKTYRVHSAWRLSDMTHERGSPWDLVWNNSAAVGSLGLRLKNEDIKAYFSQLVKLELVH